METEQEAKAYFDKLRHSAGKQGLAIVAEVAGKEARETGLYMLVRSWPRPREDEIILGPNATLEEIEDWLDKNYPEGGSP